MGTGIALFQAILWYLFLYVLLIVISIVITVRATRIKGHSKFFYGLIPAAIIIPVLFVTIYFKQENRKREKLNEDTNIAVAAAHQEFEKICKLPLTIETLGRSPALNDEVLVIDEEGTNYYRWGRAGSFASMAIFPSSPFKSSITRRKVSRDDLECVTPLKGTVRCKDPEYLYRYWPNGADDDVTPSIENTPRFVLTKLPPIHVADVYKKHEIVLSKADKVLARTYVYERWVSQRPQYCPEQKEAVQALINRATCSGADNACTTD